MFQALLILGTLALQPAGTPPVAQTPQSNPARVFMDSLAYSDTKISSMTGDIQYTIIQALESDLQKRNGQLYLRTLREDQYNAEHRDYAVRFDTLQLDDRQSDIREHYIFDGRWFVERLPDQKQFNKRELVAADEELDPMELMREAPFWVSLGHNTDRVFESYDIELLDHTAGLMDNANFPELSFLAAEVPGTQQIKLTPKPGSGLEDDWEWVRIWFDKESFLPMLYVKAEWTGDLQIVQLLNVETNTKLNPSLFDTTTPPAESGWRVQISPWRGQAQAHADQVDTQPLEDRLNESTP